MTTNIIEAQADKDRLVSWVAGKKGENLRHFCAPVCVAQTEGSTSLLNEYLLKGQKKAGTSKDPMNAR
jgi:hypothetical protein